MPTPSTKPPAASSSSIYDEPPTKNIYEEMEEADRAAEARKLFSKGIAAADEGQWADAYDALAKAWKLKEHWQIAYQLAKVEIRTERFRAAVTHIDVTLAADDPDARAVKDECFELRAKARAGIAYLRVRGTPAGARVMVDGELRGKLPLLDPIEVDPGAREVVVRLGDLSVSTRIVAVSAQTMQANLNLPSPEIDTPPPPPVPPPSRTPMLLGLTGIGIGVTGAFVGTVLWTAAVHNDVLVQVAETAPPPTSPSRSALIRDASALSRDETAGAVTAWVLGGACLLGGVAYWSYSQLKQPIPPATAVFPVLSSQHAGLVVTGAW